MSSWTAGNTGTTVVGVLSFLVGILATAVAYFVFFRNNALTQWQLAMSLEEEYQRVHRANLQILRQYKHDANKDVSRQPPQPGSFPAYYINYKAHRTDVWKAYWDGSCPNLSKQNLEVDEALDALRIFWRKVIEGHKQFKSLPANLFQPSTQKDTTFGHASYDWTFSLGKTYRLLAEPFEIADFYAEYSVLAKRNHYLPDKEETRDAKTGFRGRRFKTLEDAEKDYIETAQKSGKRWWASSVSAHAQQICIRPRDENFQVSTRFATMERDIAVEEAIRPYATPFPPTMKPSASLELTELHSDPRRSPLTSEATPLLRSTPASDTPAQVNTWRQPASPINS